MSQENVEVVKRAWEAWSSGDVDAVLATCDPATTRKAPDVATHPW